MAGALADGELAEALAREVAGAPLDGEVDGAQAGELAGVVAVAQIKFHVIY